jgi:uncharacterized protein (UPF0548 family)
MLASLTSTASRALAGSGAHPDVPATLQGPPVAPATPPQVERYVAAWRFGFGWSDAELKRRLAELERRHVNFGVLPEAMTVEGGWTRDGISDTIGRERPGPPEPDGVFERAKRAMADYEFSDPRIVVGHFDPEAPLDGREMLLEIKVFGLRFLGATRVTAVVDETDGEHTTFGFRYDTLASHFERGFERFVLVKDHRSGEVTFTIEALWQVGDFPTWWSRLGFRLVGERFRELWRTRAIDRLRRIARRAPEGAAVHGGLAHGGEQRSGEAPAALASPALARLATWAERASRAALVLAPRPVMRSQRLKRAWLGACIGLFAAVPQVVVGKAEDLLILPHHENADIAPRFVKRLARLHGRDLSPAAQWALGTLFHFAYGAAWGSAYAVVVPRAIPAALGGSAMGAAIYTLAFSRVGAGTVTGSERPHHRRTLRMMLTHWSVALTYAYITAFLSRAIPRDDVRRGARLGARTRDGR